ncbi:MAG: HipA N-terminal domain-containing protein [Verrucomicrobiota bacterium]
MARIPRRALIRQHGVLAGELREADGGGWIFGYMGAYDGPAVSLTMPVREAPYVFSELPPFLEGLLPEGPQLEAIIRKHKIDRSDGFGLLMAVGHDMVGSLTAEAFTDTEGGDA